MPNPRFFLKTVLIAYGLISTGIVHADMPFDMASTVEVGSWQEREEVTTNHKGKVKSIAVVWMGVVAEEMREGQPHVWLEMRSQNFKEGRGGNRKPKGKPAIMKTLVPVSAFGDVSDPSSNMRKFGKEIIIQTGDQAPMRIREGGAMADMALKSFGGNMDFQFDNTGTQESINVPAGSFDTYKVSGHGSMEMNLIIRKIRVESQSISWFSKNVPMGVVKQETQSSSNGKVTTIKSELLRHGKGDAQSMINDAEVQDMPTIDFPGLGREGG